MTASFFEKYMRGKPTNGTKWIRAKKLAKLWGIPSRRTVGKAISTL